MELQIKQSVIEQLYKHVTPVELGINPEVQDEQLVVELQTEQLEIPQLKGHALLVKMWPEIHDEQVLEELQTPQKDIEQLYRH